MEIKLGSVALYLLMTGAFAHATCAALRRGDGPASLAMGLGAVVTGHLADLPASILAWASAAMTLALVAAFAGVIATAVLGSRSAFKVGAIGTPVLLAAMLFSATDPARAGMDQPPELGSVVSDRIAAVVRNGR